MTTGCNNLKCLFVHNDYNYRIQKENNNKSSRNAKDKTNIVCKFYFHGKCVKGVQCPFIHEIKNETKSLPLSDSPPLYCTDELKVTEVNNLTNDISNTNKSDQIKRDASDILKAYSNIQSHLSKKHKFGIIESNSIKENSEETIINSVN
jgi:hypothetical protein